MKLDSWHQLSMIILQCLYTILLSHPYVIGYKESFIDESTSTLCVVMEHADSGDVMSKVNEHLKRNSYFKEYEIWNYFA